MARKFEDSRRRLQEQNAVIDSFAELLVGIHDLGTENPGAETKLSLARMILESALRIMECSSGSLMVLDRETNELVALTAMGMTDEGPPIRLKVGEGIAGRVAENGKTIIVNNIDTDARFLNRKNLEYHMNSMISVPLKVKKKVIGVLNIHADSPESFGERNVRLLNILVDHSSITIENLDLYNSLQTFYLEMVETLAKALELKEYEPKNHPLLDHNRNRIYARAIAEELNLPESIIRYVEFASLMHGIGKMGVGEAILRKPGKLTAEEYEEVKKHPEIGQRIISNVKFLSPVLPMILYHQERWDGKGYPAGLKGEEIPLGSRIVSAINAYHAMVSDRPYRAALSVDEAVLELKRGAGAQFDPKVVEAFVRVLEKGKGNPSENRGNDPSSIGERARQNPVER